MMLNAHTEEIGVGIALRSGQPNTATNVRVTSTDEDRCRMFFIVLTPQCDVRYIIDADDITRTQRSELIVDLLTS